MFVTAVLRIFTPLPIFTTEKKWPLYITFSLHCKYDVIIFWIGYTYFALFIVPAYVYNLVVVLIWCPMLNYSVKYQILGNQFRKMGVIRSIKTTQNINKCLFHSNLIDLVKTPQKLYGYKPSSLIHSKIAAIIFYFLFRPEQSIALNLVFKMYSWHK